MTQERFDKVCEGIGIGIGISLFIVPIVALVLLFTGIPKVSFSMPSFNLFGPSLMTGADLAKMDPVVAKTPMGKKMIDAFDKDNGKAYCVPKMSKEEMDALSSSVLVTGLVDPESMFKDVDKEQLRAEFKADPFRTLMKVAFASQYPCK